LAVHLTAVDEPATTEVGVHETVVSEVFGVTVNEKVPTEDGLLLSPA
jgi:hypothetical protein